MKKSSKKGKNGIGVEKNKSRNEGWFVAMEEAEERGLMVAGGEKEREREQSQKDKKEKEECCRQSHLFTKKNYTYIYITACSSDFFSFPH